MTRHQTHERLRQQAENQGLTIKQVKTKLYGPPSLFNGLNGNSHQRRVQARRFDGRHELFLKKLKIKLDKADV
jgi:hypothetical protein